MNSMNELRLNDVCEIFSGYAFNTKDMVEEGTPILKIGNINEDKTLNLNCDCFYPKNITKKLEKYILLQNDFLICMTGATIGKIGKTATKLNQIYLINQRVGIMRSKENIDNNFLYYVLCSNEFRKYVELVGYGAAQANISASNIGKFKIDINIDMVNQKKIGKILSNYDELIETNNQRIKILENTAQELYKEWFVRFRYPGYEKDEMILNKTKGWSFGKSVSFCPKSFANYELIKIGEFKRGKNITASEIAEGNVPVISAGLQPSGYHNEFNVEGKSITVSASGANAGYLSYRLDNIWAADCSYCQSGYLWFLYNALKFLQPVITNLQCGSAQPHVYAKNLNRLNLILPNNFELIKKYNDLVSPLYDEIKVLNDKNIYLVKQRDSLLPRLMSGKLSVEGKEII